MTTTVRALLLALGGVATPATALACATCVSSAFGDRTYNWAYLGLLAMPFLLAAVVGVVIAWSAGVRPASLFSGRGDAVPAPGHRTSVKETT